MPLFSFCVHRLCLSLLYVYVHISRTLIFFFVFFCFVLFNVQLVHKCCEGYQKQHLSQQCTRVVYNAFIYSSWSSHVYGGWNIMKSCPEDFVCFLLSWPGLVKVLVVLRSVLYCLPSRFALWDVKFSILGKNKKRKKTKCLSYDLVWHLLNVFIIFIKYDKMSYVENTQCKCWLLVRLFHCVVICFLSFYFSQ